MDRDRYPLARSADPRRTLDLESWTAAAVPLLRDPREFVTELHRRHLPQPGTVVVTVLDALHQVSASASFMPRPHHRDGWQHRNAILAHLRQVIPHGLRRAAPTHTAVLLRCRDGAAGWSPEDGTWMWALHDAAALHGLRCGSYVTLTPAGWRILGDDRSGRSPHAGSWVDGPVHTVTELPPRAPGVATTDTATTTTLPDRGAEAWSPARVTGVERPRRSAAR
ncbi:hypothetical protein [Kitasatospora sp. NBC_00315]|uniref:hypothetical protein n=1 Tax=Kitasatospora sp. NBC_00315 TaxID=2975963 RepID=UPI0032548701